MTVNRPWSPSRVGRNQTSVPISCLSPAVGAGQRTEQATDPRDLRRIELEDTKHAFRRVVVDGRFGA